MKTLFDWSTKFFRQTGWKAVLFSVVGMIVVAVPFVFFSLFLFLKIVSPLQMKQQEESPPPTLVETTVSTTKVFDFLVGEPKFFLEPTWGISGKPTLATPVLVTNKTDQRQQISPTTCFEVNQEGKVLKQIFPLGGEVSVGGILSPEGSQLGWLYFEGVDPSKSSIFSGRCAENHETFTMIIPAATNN